MKALAAAMTADPFAARKAAPSGVSTSARGIEPRTARNATGAPARRGAPVAPPGGAAASPGDGAASPGDVINRTSVSYSA